MTDADPTPPRKQPPSSRRPPKPTPRTVDSQDLLHGAAELLIQHAGEVYRLRVTRNGKLILHK